MHMTIKLTPEQQSKLNSPQASSATSKMTKSAKLPALAKLEQQLDAHSDTLNGQAIALTKEKMTALGMRLRDSVSSVVAEAAAEDDFFGFADLFDQTDLPSAYQTIDTTVN
jgi:hypothetical protein